MERMQQGKKIIGLQNTVGKDTPERITGEPPSICPRSFFCPEDKPPRHACAGLPRNGLQSQSFGAHRRFLQLRA
ncbi:hypothetical protein E2320_013094 [Naja naja]|nr:hypothetical protein E2320_013094 [Naja naja]